MALRFVILILLLNGCVYNTFEEPGETDMGPRNEHLRAWQGNVKVVSNNTRLGDPKSFMNVQFPEPGVYTVQFSIAAPSPTPGGAPPITPTSSIRVSAILTWTFEGNQIQRVFDVGDGVTISGSAAGCNISVQDLTATLPTLVGANGQEYQVSATITKGTRAQFQTPVIQPGAATNNTTPAGIPIVGITGIAPAGNTDFIVPVNAGAISVKVSTWDVTVFATVPTFVFATQFNATQTVILYRWVPTTDPAFIPLVPGCRSVRVNNGSGTDSILASLDWGIDG
jgi:hypothetical protein